jgi:hypothetical protein
MVAGSALAGFIIALLKIAASETQITTKKAIFRALSNSFLAMSACAVLLVIPDVDIRDSNTLFVGILGLSMLIGSLGTSGLEAILKHKLG